SETEEAPRGRVMTRVDKAIDLLGFRVRDVITNIEGVATSVSFDLYGCIQIVLDRGYDEKNERIETPWLDLVRLEKLEGDRLLTLPDFAGTDVSGPAEKPSK
ncbi:MAG: hypothetical protein DRJ50_04285, partial [Actinobacteria bacterium]